MKNLKLFALLLLIIAACSMIYFQHTKYEGETVMVSYENKSPLGVWWWNNKGFETHQLMEFAVSQGVTEIYWSAGLTRPRWCEKTTTEFLKLAHTKGIDVYYLTGDWAWIYNPDHAINRLEAFLEWQKSSCYATRFAGVHLNIEPHQSPNWNIQDKDATREILQSYINLKVLLTSQFGSMDWTSSFWWHSEKMFTVEYRGEMMYLYRAAILEANRIFVMSYRNTAQAMYSIGQHHVEFAQKMNRPILLSALVYPGSENPEYTHVFFSNLGHEYMINELAQLQKLVEHPKLGIAVHEIVGWYNMYNSN